MISIPLPAAVWDGLLETRIKLQKVLGACNQMPHSEHLDKFLEEGGSQVEGALKDCEYRGSGGDAIV